MPKIRVVSQRSALERLPVKTSYPKDKIRVVLLEGIHPAAEELFGAEGFQVERHASALDGAALAEAVGGAHVLGIRSKTQVTGGVLAGAGSLLSVGCFCIGTNQVDLRAACGRGVPVFNAPFSNTRSVAELTVAEVVALHRRLFEKSAGLHRGVWDKSAAGAHEVRGRTLGIVGYGHIGSQVSVLGEALGMRVIYFDIARKLPIGNARAVRSLDELLVGSDVVTLHVPATAGTERMMGAAQLARMRPGAHLINNARGSVVDVAALVAALRAGRLGGAALDVFPREPAGKDEAFESELRGLANVILTPHIGGSTEEAQGAIAEDVCGKLIRFVNNGSTSGAVNVPEVELPEQGGGERDAGTEGRRDEGESAGEEEKGGTENNRTDTGSHSSPASPPSHRPSVPPSLSLPPRRHRILHFHRNVPGVLSKMHALIAGLGANVAAEYLQTNRDVGYVVLDVDPTDAEPIVAGLRSIPETVRVRILW